MKDYRIFIGIGLILFSLYNTPIISSIKNTVFKSSKETVENDPFIQSTMKAASLVTDKKDRINLSIFNESISEKMDGYLSKNISAQEVLNIYSESLKEYFKDSLKDKYAGLSEEVEKIIKDIIGEDDHILSKEELDKLKQSFLALSINLKK